MLSSFCSPLNSIPDIPGIISVVTAGIISVVIEGVISVAEIISMVGIISVAVQAPIFLFFFSQNSLNSEAPSGKWEEQKSNEKS